MDGVRTYIIIFGTRMRGIALGTDARIFAIPCNAAIGSGRGTANGAGDHGTGLTKFIGALIRSRAGIAVVANIRIGGIHASPADALNSIRTNVVILDTRVRRVALRTRVRRLALPG